MTRPLLALALLVAGCGPKAPEKATVPVFPGANLVFVSFDALQAAHVGFMGNPRDATPNLDAFARDAHRFVRATSAASWTVPATMTWFTGAFPSEHRMTNKFVVYDPPVERTAKLKELAPGLTTLAEALKAAGYATGGFTGNAGVSGPFGFDAGFDVYDGEPGKFGAIAPAAAKALEWIKSNKDRKFFLFLHGYDVHGQFLPPGGLDHRFVAPDYDFRYTGTEREQEALREEGLDKGALDLRPEDVAFWRAVYDEKAQRADSAFQGFLDGLAALGLMDQTLFVVTSDHGAELGEHRRLDHGFSLYEELIHVPLVVKFPGQRQGATVDRRASGADLMPTVLALLGVEGPQSQMRGRPLFGADRSGRDVFAETDYRDYTFKRAIVAPDDWKLIVTLESGRRELYDLGSDPGESLDLAEREPQRADELQRRLFGHFKAMGRDLEGRSWKVGLNPVYSSQGKGR